MEQKEWNRVLDRYLIENTMLSEEYEQLNIEQKFVIQEIKKSAKRIIAKANYPITELLRELNNKTL